MFATAVLAQPSLNEVLIFFAGLALASIVSAWWVYRDGRARSGRRGDTLLWAVGTLIALPIALPLYLLFVRPTGDLVRCPACGSATLSHKAVCQHCEQPIPFDAQPRMWGLGEIVGITLVFGLTLPFAAGMVGIGEGPGFGVFSMYAVVQSVLLATLAIYVVRRRYRLPLDLLGLRRKHAAALAGLGLLLSVVMVFVSKLVEDVAVALIGVFVGQQEALQMAEAEHMSNPVTEVLRSGLTIQQLAGTFVVLSVIVPVAEEIFFRGFVYRALRARWGLFIALLGSAAFFGVVHLELVHFLPIAVLGVVLAYSLERTGSLVPAVIVHAVNNAVAVFGVLYGWDI